MTVEARLRSLAQDDANLQPYFFTDDQIRFFDKQLVPGYLKLGKSCLRYRRISTVFLSSHGTTEQSGHCRITAPRFQFDVLDFESERARSAAQAVIDWLLSIDLSSNDQFGSPAVSPKRHPVTVLSRREDLEFMTQPPAHVVSIDARILALEE